MKILSKTISLITSFLQTLTPLEALKRYAKLSNLLCAQRITFNRALEPSITPAANLKLTTWYVLSLLCAMVGTSFCFILTQQLLSNKKDVDISMAMCLTLIMASAAAMLSTTVCCTYHSRADELLFVIRNLWNSRGNADLNTFLYVRDILDCFRDIVDITNVTIGVI